MTKILYLIDGLPHGGAERQLSLLARSLPPDWQTRVVSLGGGLYDQVLRSQNIPIAVYERRFRYDLIPVLQLLLEIIRYKPDIVHSWGGLCSAIAAPICKVLRIPFVEGSIRSGSAPKRHSWRTRVTLSISDFVVANSCAGLSNYQLSPEKCRVIYNAFDPGRLDILNTKTSEQAAVQTIVMTGRISPEKDFASFFEAARRLHMREHGCWRFIAIGADDGNDREKFIQPAGDLVASGVVELPQPGLEVLPYLRDAQVGVLLSTAGSKEGFSNSIMEYMAARLPVICTDSGGNRELVIQGETGYLIPSENVDALIEMLLLLKHHQDISDRMGNAGYQRVMSLCSLDRMVSDFVSVYNGLLP